MLKDLHISLAVMLIAMTFLLWNPPFLRHLEGTVLDWHFQLRGGHLPSVQPVTLVMVDDASLERFGRWPWSRTTMARLIRMLGERYGARVIVTDLVFSEPESAALQQLVTWMRKRGHPLSDELAREIQADDADHMLARAIRQSPARVVQGFYYYSSAAAAAHGPAGKAGPVRGNLFDHLVDRSGGANATVRAVELNTNIPMLAKASGAAGFLNFIPDVDGAIRFSPLLVRYDGFYFPSLALAAARAWNDGAALTARIDPDAVEVALGERQYELTAQGMAWINYYGPAGTMAGVSAADVLTGRADMSLLKDRLVLLGVSAAGIEDVRTTPVDVLMPGAEIHATLIDNLLNGDFLKRPDAIYLLEITLMLGIGLLYGMLFGRVVQRTHGVFSLLLLLGVALAAHLLFRQGIWMHIVTIELQLALTMMILFALHYGRELLRRQRMRHAFASFVDPAVVDEVVGREEEVGLSGDEREISVMFVDVAGFTSLSERLSPTQVVHHINGFFDAATPIVFANGGCVDRLTGDGLIALFGAPIADDAHAVHACRAALGLERALEPLRPVFEALKHPLHVRIGINSGGMVVGNMGSSQRLQYTFMGDAGNTAARLESLNKQYGSTRMIGEATLAGLNGEFVCRELDRVVLVGKTEAVSVYELLGEARNEARWRPLIDAYARALELYRRGKFAEAAAAFEQSWRQFADAPSRQMWQRCVALERRPPENWQGIWRAVAK